MDNTDTTKVYESSTEKRIVAEQYIKLAWSPYIAIAHIRSPLVNSLTSATGSNDTTKRYVQPYVGTECIFETFSNNLSDFIAAMLITCDFATLRGSKHVRNVFRASQGP